jgi:hypothetical protein
MAAVIFLLLYFLPTIIACCNRHRSSVGIILVNFFLGWTLIGWICCFIWSVVTPHAPVAQPIIIYNNVNGSGNQNVPVHQLPAHLQPQTALPWSPSVAQQEFLSPPVPVRRNSRETYDEVDVRRVEMQSPPLPVFAVSRTARGPIDPAKIPKAQHLRLTSYASAYGETGSRYCQMLCIGERRIPVK